MRTAYRALVFMSVLAGAAPASAQDADHSVSVGGSISGLGLFNETGRPKTSPGTGAWLTAHLLGPLALEGRMAWFPTKEPVQFESQGGRTLKVTAGARGTLVASRRMRLYGILQPGIIRFSNTASGDADGHTTVGPKTHFAIDMGGAVELFPQSRWTARFDFVQTLFVVPGAVLTPPAPCCEPSLSAESKGEIAETFQVSAGVGYRLGTRRPVSTGSTVTPSIGRLNIGGQFAYAITSTFGELSPFHDAGVGAFLSYRLSRHVFADGALSAFTREAEVRSPWEGGRVVQGLAGIKVGRRKEGVGLFVKARAGVNSHSEAIHARDHAARTFTFARSNGAALDLGGIVEVDTGPRLRLRFEAGDLTELYSARTITIDGVLVEQPPFPRSQQNIQMSLGVGWRF